MPTCKNSLGPWALLAGPKTPVITNYELGKRLFKVPIKGILPPIPNILASFPKNYKDALFTDSSK